MLVTFLSDTWVYQIYLYGLKITNKIQVKMWNTVSGVQENVIICILLMNDKNADNCWHLNIYEQDKFHAQLS